VALTEALLETSEGVLGDVLGERARPGARKQDARDGLVLEGAVGECMTESGLDVVCGAPSPSCLDPASVRQPPGPSSALSRPW
jgi:hypothetical protein